MVEQASQTGVAEPVASTDAPVVETAASVETAAPTPSRPARRGRPPKSGDAAITDAYNKVFAGADDEGAPSAKTEAPRKGPTGRRRAKEEEVEEIEGIEGATEADDGVEPDAEAEPDAGGDEAGETEDAETGKKEEAAEAPTLDPILRQAAKRAGWTDEAIDKLANLDPEMAQEAFGRTLQSLNALSEEYAQIGRAGTDADAPAPETKVKTRQTAEADADPMAELFGSNEKAAAIREKYGTDFVDDVLTPLLQPIREMQETANQQKSDAIASEAEAFFKNLPEHFKTIYGGNGTHDTEEQQNSHDACIRLADWIRQGARKSGVGLTVSEGLERANLIYAAKHLAEIERKRISGEVQNRSKNLTQRPTQRKSPGKTTKRSDAAAAAAYEERAAELGFNISDAA